MHIAGQSKCGKGSFLMLQLRPSSSLDLQLSLLYFSLLERMSTFERTPYVLQGLVEQLLLQCYCWEL